MTIGGWSFALGLLDDLNVVQLGIRAACRLAFNDVINVGRRGITVRLSGVRSVEKSGGRDGQFRRGSNIDSRGFAG